MAYRTGELDQRIKLLRKTNTPDGIGGFTTAWNEYAELWAHVRPMSGREREQSMRTEAAAMYLVVIRQRKDVVEGDAIEWMERNLNIRFVKQRGRAAFLEIEAEIGARL